MLHTASGSPMTRRSVQSDFASLPETLKSWDSCMAKSFCKYPVIAGIVVGALVLISTAWCCYRCCCRRRRKAARSKSTFFNDPVPTYMSGQSPSSAEFGGQPAAPQYAYFESGTTGGKNNDDLPVMPSWNGSKSEKIEDSTVKVEDIELGEVDNGRQQQQPQRPAPALNAGSSSPPSHRLPLSNPSQFRSNQPNFPPSNNLNPFGPQRMNSPFRAPNGGIIPPSRTQSPYPENNSMPSINPFTAPVNGASDFDFSPHINAHNQGPYANADIYPPEPTYQQPQFTAQQPQFTGVTSSTPAPYQQNTYTGTTVAETHTPPPQQQPYQPPPLPMNASGTGFVAQMDDDFGHSPVHLTNPHTNNTTAPPQNNAPFNPNEFDHGGYSSYNQPSRPQQQQAWTAF
ncbi:hypothetical protein H072_1792 [Dactylellina haptotyla CBS 200.50]|uniref:Uncharacterized protein n=1 Tax=Dactylellina haptotyla (strain CBS 200.50) TaxID=1284197 RepID=S8C987_DACHA|nr:hypothetical protein H072_1792 [Dactylellina haptotyla CBS 200.50]